MASGRSHSILRHDIDVTHEHEYGYHPSNPTPVLEHEYGYHPSNPIPVLEIETVARGDSFQNQNRNHVVPVTVGDEGVSLTWQDLWVTVQGRACRSILQGLTGHATPGQLLAIMGPSGCGKSTLLDALAGRLSSNTRQTGGILINGHKQALAYGTSAYVTQDDALITTLTVEEAVYYSAQLQLPDSVSKSEKKERAQATIREMGLQDAVNTRIGGWGDKASVVAKREESPFALSFLHNQSFSFWMNPQADLIARRLTM